VSLRELTNPDGRDNLRSVAGDAKRGRTSAATRRGTPRLLLLELRASDPYSQLRLGLYPFLLGAARSRRVPARWLFLGFDADRQMAADLTVTLAKADLARLETTIETFAPTHLLVNERLAAGQQRHLRVRFPRLAWRPSRFSDVRLTWGELTDWLGLPAGRGAERMLVDRARPAFDFAPLVPGTDPGERLLQILGGPSCLYARRTAASPAFRELALDERTGHARGCSFCGWNPQELRYPYRTPALELVLAQLEAARRAGRGRPRPPRYLIDGGAIYPQVDRLFRRVLERRHPPSEFHFACRADELVRHGVRLERVLPGLARAGHSVHFSNMGVENFSPAENERLNKGLTQADIAGALELLARWAQRWPGTVEFDRHGGFGFILFTPWTTLADLRTNLRALRDLGLRNSGFCVTTRLLLLPDRPITRLAERDGLTAAEFDDRLMAEFCRAGCITEWGQREVAWRFREPVVGLIHAVLLRRVPEAVAGRKDPAARLVAEAIRRLPAASQDWLGLLELLIDAVETDPGVASVAQLLARLPRQVRADRKHEVRPSPGAARALQGVERRLHLRRGPGWGRFALEALVRETGRLRLDFSHGDARMALWIEPRARRPEAFRLTRRYAIYHAADTPPDTPDKLELVEAVARALER
jgi:hypothetical protein